MRRRWKIDELLPPVRQREIPTIPDDSVVTRRLLITFQRRSRWIWPSCHRREWHGSRRGPPAIPCAGVLYGRPRRPARCTCTVSAHYRGDLPGRSSNSGGRSCKCFEVGVNCMHLTIKTMVALVALCLVGRWRRPRMCPWGVRDRPYCTRNSTTFEWVKRSASMPWTCRRTVVARSSFGGRMAASTAGTSRATIAPRLIVNSGARFC